MGKCIAEDFFYVAGRLIEWLTAPRKERRDITKKVAFVGHLSFYI
jgi:hypothetical protein